MIKKLTAVTGMLVLASFVATSAFAAPHTMSTKKSYAIANKQHVTANKQHVAAKKQNVTVKKTHYSESGHH